MNILEAQRGSLVDILTRIRGISQTEKFCAIGAMQILILVIPVWSMPDIKLIF